MNAFRTIQRVHNRVVTVVLPDDFIAETVEVMVSATDAAATLPGDQLRPEEPVRMADDGDRVDALLQQLRQVDTSHVTEAQQRHWADALERISHGPEPGVPPVLGLFEGLGLVQYAADFDAPLDDLFYGDDTDAYGRSQP